MIWISYRRGCVARRGRRSRSNEKCLVGFVSFAWLWKNVGNGWIPVSVPKKFHLCKLCVPLHCCSFYCVACFLLSLRLLRSSCSERSCCGPVVLIFRSSAEAGSVQLFVPSVKLYSGVYFMFFSFVAFLFLFFLFHPSPPLSNLWNEKKNSRVSLRVARVLSTRGTIGHSAFQHNIWSLLLLLQGFTKLQ